MTWPLAHYLEGLADISCVDPNGQATVVQCKKYRPHSSVGWVDVQQSVGMAFV